MNSLLNLILIFIAIAISNIKTESEICTENNKNPQIVNAFQFLSRTFFMTSEHNFYYTDQLQYDDNGISIANNSVFKQRLKNWSELSTMRYFFKVLYPNDKGVMRLVGIRIEESYGISGQFFGYLIQFDLSFDVILPLDKFPISIYKYEPGKDPLNLMTLFLKFPDQDLDRHMLSIMNFPLDNRLPQRFFVYYLESPISKTDNSFDFKRHVLIGEKVNYETSEDMDWAHDLPSGKCFDQKFIVNASFSLTDKYTKSGSNYEFDLLEFSLNEYNLKKVYLSANNVSSNLKTITSGSILGLFSCPTTTTTPTPKPIPTPKPTPTSTQSTQPTRESDKSFWNDSTIWIVLTVVVIIIAVIICCFVGVLTQVPDKTGQLVQKPNTLNTE